MKHKYIIALALFCSMLMFSQNDKSWSKMAASEKSFYELQTEFNNYWSNKTPEKGQGYKIFKRWENQIEDKVYPSGDLSLPSNTYPNFIAWQQRYNSEFANNANNQMKTIAATSSWTTLNQGSVASGYDAGSGRINFITFDPISPSTTMYVGAPDGGLWKSTNGGTSWTTNTDYLSIIGCSGLVIHPTNPNLMYLATGDRESDRRSIGVLKSTDGGANWNTTGLVWTVSDNYRISKIVMDPNNPLVMMISTDGGIFRTIDGWDSFETQTIFDPLSDVKYKPGSSTIAYAAGSQIYKSTDGGINWVANTSVDLPNAADVERIEMAVTAADNSYVYAIIGKSSDQGFEGFYRSTDSGDTFVKQSTASTPNILHSSASPTAASVGGQAFHDLAIAVSPVNKDKVTIGGINQWQSTDGGANWTRITYWLGVNPAYPGRESAPEPYIHADIQYIAYMPGSSTTFFTTCDGGVSKTTDDGVTWTDMTNNIAVSQQTNIALSSLSPNFFFAGLQDIGSLKYNSGSWSVLSGGDGEDGFVDRSNDNVLISSTTNGAFYISTDGGATTNDLTFTPALPSGDWFTPIKQDPVDIDKIYIGSGKDLYVSNDWFTANPTASKTGTTAPTPIDKNILRFEIAPSNTSTIYVIKDNVISKSTNSGSTWSNITSGLPVASAKLKNLTVSNTDASKVWVVFSGYAAGEKVYKTTDGGTTWGNVSNGLPNIPMNTIVYRKNSVNDEVYIGADIGVYAVDNLMTSAVPYLTDLPKCAVTDLEIYYPTPTTGILRAATYGRGSWQTILSDNVTYVWNGSVWNNTPEGAITSSDNMIVQPGSMASLSSGISVANLTVESGASIEADNGNITVTGNVVNNGAISGSSQVILNSATAVVTGTGSMTNLTVGASGVAIANGTQIVSAQLDVISGGSLNANGNITLVSNAIGTARVDEVDAGSITGNVNVQRYIPAGNRAFRFIGSTVSGPTVFDSWQESGNNATGFGVQISGTVGIVGTVNATTGHDETVSGSKSMFTWNTASQSWTSIDNTHTQVLNAGDYYRLLIRGDRTTNLSTNNATHTATTLRATGTLMTGSMTVTPGIAAGEFFALANPFQSKVSMVGTATGTTSFMYYWDPNLGTRGGYSTINMTTGMGTAGVATNVLDAGQAVFLADAAGSSSVTINEANKVSGNNNGGVFNITPLTQALRLKLYQTGRFNNGQSESDGLYIDFDASHNINVDFNDGVKLDGLNVNMSIAKTTGELLSVDSRTLPTTNEVIDLSLVNYLTTAYTFNATLDILPGFTVYLKDNLTGNITELVQNSSTAYNFTVDLNNAQSINPSRFQIEFQMSTLGNEELSFNDAVSIFPNPVNGDLLNISLGILTEGKVEVTLFNTLGQKVIAREFDSISNGVITLDKLSGLTNGLYLLNISNGKDTVVKKVILNHKI